MSHAAFFHILQAFLLKGNTLQEMGRHTEALAQFHHCLTIRADFSPAKSQIRKVRTHVANQPRSPHGPFKMERLSQKCVLFVIVRFSLCVCVSVWVCVCVSLWVCVCVSLWVWVSSVTSIRVRKQVMLHSYALTGSLPGHLRWKEFHSVMQSYLLFNP